MKKKIITICSSGSFYKEVIEIRDTLKGLGFEVLIPVTAKKMEKSGDFDISKHKGWYSDPKLYNQKIAKMKGHLRQVEKGDSVLVVNKTKKGIKGYVGGNVLLEMFRGWQLHKPIYVLHQVSDRCSLKEEVHGMSPIFIDGDLTKIV